MIKRLGWSVVAIALISCNGCATLLAGGPSYLDVEVEHPRDDVTVVVRGIDNEDEQTHREAKFQTVMDRGTAYAVGVSAPGYEPDLVIVKKTNNPAVWLNFVPMVAGVGIFMFTGFQALTNPSAGGLFLPGAIVALTGEVVTLVGFLVDGATKNALRHEKQRVTFSLESQTPGTAQEP